MSCNEFKDRSLLLPASDIKAQHIGILILMRILDIIEKIFPSIYINFIYSAVEERLRASAKEKKCHCGELNR
jgi:hypothetical protein